MIIVIIVLAFLAGYITHGIFFYEEQNKLRQNIKNSEDILLKAKFVRSSLENEFEKQKNVTDKLEKLKKILETVVEEKE